MCVCAIAQDHSVALLNLRDHRCLLLASCHRFPVQTVRWKPAEDFLIIGLSDGSVYVWQIESGEFAVHTTQKCRPSPHLFLIQQGSYKT